MARATFVKAARKDYPDHGIKKGESYYWWAFMQGGRGGPKRYSKTPPKRSQLTQSEFWSAVFDLQDDRSQAPDFDSLESERDDLVSELQNILDETQGKLDNMPDGLRDGDSGNTLQERIDALELAISEMESADISFDDDMQDIPEDKREEEESLRKDQRAEEIWSEITSYLDLSCS